MSGYWEELERPAPEAVAVPGAELRVGSRVRLAPRPGGDVFDIALAGRTAVVESIEQDLDGTVRLAVVVHDDPGRDLGFARQPGHRFFFAPDELEVIPGEPDPSPADQRILVAGIGNVFLGDDGFGVALVDRLARRALPPGVDAVDFGVRGMDLALAMQDGYEAVVLLDATPRGQRPGTLYVIEVDDDGLPAPATPDAHGMDPLKVLALVRAFGSVPPRTFLVGCEPQTLPLADEDDPVVELSEPVRAALEPAVQMVQSLLEEIQQEVSRT